MRRTIRALGFALALACLWAGLSLGGRPVAHADPPPTPTPTCPPGANCTNGTGGGGHQGG